MENVDFIVEQNARRTHVVVHDVWQGASLLLLWACFLSWAQNEVMQKGEDAHACQW